MMRNRNTNSIMLKLFASRLVVLFVGFGLFPLLPVYAVQFGATRSIVGVFFAIIYLSNALGSMLNGWLAERISRRAIFIGFGLLGVPALLLLAQARELWQAIVLTSIVWFSGGIDLALISVFVSLNAKGKNLGKSFSLLSLTAPLGSLVGGTVAGQLIAWQSFGSLFLVLSAIWALLPLIGVFGLRDVEPEEREQASGSVTQEGVKLSGKYYLVLMVIMLASISISASRLGAPMMMQVQNFSPTEIATSATASGLVTIPAILLIGFLSNRMGNKSSLALGCLLGIGGAVTLNQAHQLWQYWLAATLMMAAFSSNGSMASALVAEILNPRTINRGMSWINTFSTVGSIISYAGTGYVIDNFGSATLFSGSIVMAAVAVAVLMILSAIDNPLAISMKQKVITVCKAASRIWGSKSERMENAASEPCAAGD
jgi:MFS family permease